MLLQEERSVQSEPVQQQVDRILHSEQFRSSEVLRRLLSFLTEKALAGEADTLKEYVVAIDGLGKSVNYDPQHNSTVRIQMGRLRQRLAEYYREEGKDDPIIVDLPKGRFRLTFESRPVAHSANEEPLPRLEQMVAPAPVREPSEAPVVTVGRSWGKIVAIAACALALLAVAYGLGYTTGDHHAQEARFNDELRALWAPFFAHKHPLLVSIEDPLFAEIRSNPGVYIRDRSMNEWSDVAKSKEINALTASLKQPEMRPSRYYTAFGEAEASFLLGSLLDDHEHPASIVRTSQLSWQQLADNNVVFVGVQNLFFNQLRNMPIAPQLVPELTGVRDLHPANGQPGFYPDEYTTAPTEQGTIYALVTHLPGPNGKNDIVSFTSNRSAGYLGAVQSFTDPQIARTVESELVKMNGGKMPQFYQVLFRVRYRDGVPTETSFVLGREMR